VADLRAALRAPPEVLEAAARAYLLADHQRVIELLEEVGRGSGRIAAHACLLRAASWLTLAARQRREDLRARAAQEIDACPDLERHVDLSPALFSPAVVRFIESAIRSRHGPPPPRSDD
jgi:hypothetical protein